MLAQTGTKPAKPAATKPTTQKVNTVNPKLQKAPITSDLQGVKHPEWVTNATIYELNLRQFSKESTFQNLQKELPRLKKLGTNVLCLMPIQPIGKMNRKGSLGNPYAIQDFKEINKEFGTLDEFKVFMGEAHKLGLKVIIDWDATQTAADHLWTKKHPDFYFRDKGKFVSPSAEASDVYKLNYDSKDLRAEMIDNMRFWLTAYEVDGFRCHAADLLPTNFWIECRKKLDEVKPVFMLADADKPELHQAFDMTTNKSFYQLMQQVASGDKSRKELVDYFKNQRATYKPNDLRLFYTSNASTNAFEKSEFEAFGNAHQAVAAMTAVLPGAPMICSGQESAERKHIKFFEKDVINWSDYEYASFYAQLMKLHRQSRSLLPQSNFEIIDLQDNNLFAFKRSFKNEETIFVINVSKGIERLILPAALSGRFTNCSDSNELNLAQNSELVFEPNQYFILQREKPLPSK